tara:strand:+ start:533 stop:730 length:198 start_codon:yes stop_codon:yes gene_type:complete
MEKNQETRFSGVNPEVDRFTTKPRLNLNDLLRRRTQQKNQDKKTNRLIFSGTVLVGTIVLLILSV